MSMNQKRRKAQVTEPVLWVKDCFYTVLEGGGATSMALYLDSRMAKLPEDSNLTFTNIS